MIKWFADLFKKHHPEYRKIYAVTTGQFLGEMLIFIKQVDNMMHFLSVPQNTNRVIPYDKFEFGKQHKILDLVEIAPKLVVETAVKQYLKNESNN